MATANASKNMNLKLLVWRQDNAKDKGKMVSYEAKDISPDMSFLEMLDVVNESIIHDGGEPIVFEHDCREGICGSCSLMINGVAHGPDEGTAVCQVHMRSFKDGQEIVIEPWRARAFPVIRDLMTDRSAFDRIIAAGGYITANTGNAPDGNAIPIGKEIANDAMDSAACIGCGACVAQCKNASAALFTSAKVAHLALLPQGNPERAERVIHMVAQMDAEMFGSCSNEGECEAVCPKGIQMTNISFMNREYERAILMNKK
ncbi:succinate dehydrogenase subunit B [Abditibacterium utsteinense]|uniref:Succinate dehydrogenase subunit B n=2 Tax=Abditibacterium utsteinense TaxID=1960156 RepID=A0A2S8SW94_9BACT|nr:succinate dehydrogenase/fumarate reductase iron-sulfur subunit [Abditibacterium utsteinense]PQV65058.1 succinate dehydrogenase subunit B [Abditibacterium utsteinense]